MIFLFHFKIFFQDYILAIRHKLNKMDVSLCSTYLPAVCFPSSTTSIPEWRHVKVALCWKYMAKTLKNHDTFVVILIPQKKIRTTTRNKTLRCMARLQCHRYICRNASRTMLARLIWNMDGKIGTNATRKVCAIQLP